MVLARFQKYVMVETERKGEVKQKGNRALGAIVLVWLKVRNAALSRHCYRVTTSLSCTIS
jgi:hypothetical protein